MFVVPPSWWHGLVCWTVPGRCRSASFSGAIARLAGVPEQRSSSGEPYSAVGHYDGKTVTGRMLNQDGFSVQLIDSSGQLEVF